MVLAKVLEAETVGLIVMLLCQLVVFIPFIDGISSFAKSRLRMGYVRDFILTHRPRLPKYHSLQSHDRPSISFQNARLRKIRIREIVT